MSSTFLTTGDTKLIEHLHDEIYDSWVQRGIDIEKARAELFARAHDIGARIDTNFGRRLGNHTGGPTGGILPIFDKNTCSLRQMRSSMRRRKFCPFQQLVIPTS